MSDPFLTKLYHPTGLSDSDDKWVRSAMILTSLPDTPGKRMEAELRSKANSAFSPLADIIRTETKVDCRTPSGKVSAKTGLWKGATLSEGTVTLPIQGECRDGKCARERVMYFTDGYGDSAIPNGEGHPKRFHIEEVAARIYTKGNAIAKVRIDHG